MLGDVRDRLKHVPSESVHTVITSPPYWGLRTYTTQDDRIIGQEASLDVHLQNLKEVFTEVKRVLRPDGMLWLNYGDIYSGSGRGELRGDNRYTPKPALQNHIPEGFPKKCLMLLPLRVADALIETGWILRSKIIWRKPNVRPEGVRDRPGNEYEEVLLFSKTNRSFYDPNAVTVPTSKKTNPRRKDGKVKLAKGHDENDRRPGSTVSYGPPPKERPLRNVWSIHNEKFYGVHFATFPAALVERCMRLTTSEVGCCAYCGTQLTCYQNVWRKPCKCGRPGEVTPSVVLDPFAGAGTVALVAHRLYRRSISIELCPEYVELSRDRLGHENVEII